MAEYYRNCPTSTTTNMDMEKDTINAMELSEFDKDHQTLLMDNAEEGWASELGHYLGTMQHDVRTLILLNGGR